MHSTAIKSTSRSKPGKGGQIRKKPAAPGCSNRQRFLDAARCRPVDRPPVWLMRQAGRVLPEYRALREKYSFLELVQTPELAAEVTLQPIRRFDFDVAVMFSDILVVPEAMGQGYHFREAGGVAMDFHLRTAQDVDRLTVDSVVERLQYVVQALRLIKGELAGRTALLGFAGSPWTLAHFMLADGGAEEHGRGLALFRRDRALFETLCGKLTEAVGIYLRMQIEAGVDAVQIFDSHGGLAPAKDFEALSGRWIRQIVSAVGGRVPVIVFSKGANSNWKELIATGANVLGVDWNVRLGELRRHLPKDVGIQGNLNPSLLVHATPREIAIASRRLLTEMRGRPGYIFNLGHGVPPTARLEAIQSLVDTVRNF